MSAVTDERIGIAVPSTLNHLPWLSPSAGTTRPCIRDAHESLTYEGVERRVAAFAEHLLRLGVGRGDTVAVMLPNSVPLLVAMLAAWRVGAVVTPVNPAFTARELGYQLQDSGARLLVADEFLDLPMSSAAQADAAICVRTVEMQLIADGASPEPSISPEDIALVVYTSGSTGQPKGVLLDHANLNAMALSLSTHLDLTQTDQALLVLPLFHVNSLCVSFLAPISAGGSVTLLERFAPIQFVEAISQYEPTYFSAVPAIFARLMELPAAVDLAAPSLRFAICGAAPVTLELLRSSEQRLRIPILEGYGLTEATCASACNPLGGVRKPGTVGPALPGQQIAIVDGGQLVPVGVAGEVIIAGPTVMRGYLGRPEASAESLRDGWVRTGDVGFLDESGYLTLVDRIKDMIIRGGENLYPKEIEAFLATHPAVLESAVVGRPDTVYGEVPVAHVVLAPGVSGTTSDELREHCRTGLTKVKVPAEIRIVDALLRNPVGKVDKPAMRKAILSAV